MRVVAFMPIKLDSQRLAHKNTLEIAGHPLCWHLSNSLCDVDSIDEVYTFCSDSSIMDYMCPKVIFKKRDRHFDGDSVKSFELIDGFIKEVDADIYVFANVTSPFLKTETISSALDKVISGEHDSALTVKRIQTFAIFRGKPINYDINDVPRTQDIEPIYIETSGCYIFRKEVFTDLHRRIGDKPFFQEVSGLEAIDIDTPADFDLAQKMYTIYNG